MSKMVLSYVLLFPLFILGLTYSGQESVTMISLHDTAYIVHQTSTKLGGVAVAISVSDVGELREISTSVLMAETWLRTHVLSHFPDTHIMSIVVGANVLCNRDYAEEEWGLVLPSIKNIYHSLKRWGLENQIKVSAAFSQDCLHHHTLISNGYRPLLEFLMSSNSTYSIIPPPPPHFSPLKLVSLHSKSIKKLGFSKLMKNINIVIPPMNRAIYFPHKPMSRRLSFVKPFPARPTPIPPLRSTIGFSVPAHIAKNPHPPMSQTAPSPSTSPIFSPADPPLEGPPLVMPSNPPDVPIIQPPCSSSSSSSSSAPGQGGDEESGQWCVARPSVPFETLQEAMDYACGEGGADCEQIMSDGSCYFPDNVFSHSSFAFNSYWQKNKNNGGSCSFGGAAMLINTDPSMLSRVQVQCGLREGDGVDFGEVG
ncbi:hypothetical protein Sjap_017765 [Stephania japonica]|uniref:X8 domain-containing protein n=1 Tax=Stephania japonica TaxID=461633 RepID=A0AAP0NKT7_9MAGN